MTSLPKRILKFKKIKFKIKSFFLNFIFLKLFLNFFIGALKSLPRVS